MRYFKDNDGYTWVWNGSIMRMHPKPIECETIRCVEDLTSANEEVIETDAAGNPLGKYRYFRADCDDVRRNSQWRCSGSGSVEIRIDGNPNWRPSLHDRVEYLLNQQGAYECDEQGNRLEGKTAESPAAPAPMSEEERFRWQFAGQFVASLLTKSVANYQEGDSFRNAEIVKRAVSLTDLLLAELKKPKATENGGGR